MKIALYVEDGIEQIVFTPTSEIETTLLEKMSESKNISFKRGSFYSCQGGWIRQGPDDNSLIIVINTHPAVNL